MDKMKAYPLAVLNLAEAKEKQFRLIDTITKNFTGAEVLQSGDLGLVPGYGKPSTTAKVEKTLADFFGTEAAVLVRGAGTAAIRWGLWSMMNSGQALVVHKAPIYPTTKVTVESMHLQVVQADYNNIPALKKALLEEPVEAGLIQHARQKPSDKYDMQRIIDCYKERSIPVITDENYAVMRVAKIGVECGAELSAFSMFKLLGTEGIGCVVGAKRYIDKIVEANYSGGGQVQGHEAMACLRGLVYAPVALAIQGQVVDETRKRLKAGEVEGVKDAFIVNAQSKVLLVEFTEPIAKKVLAEAEKLGAAPYPVGSESKYEFVPMFYRISGAFRACDPTLEERMIRINPLRGGTETIIRILRAAMERAQK
jgi:hypothetical protein